MSRHEESGGDGFRPIGRVAEPVTTVNRVLARTGYRVFRGAQGFEAAIPEQVIERMLAFGRAAAPLEWFGLVVGRVGEDADGRHVVVLGVVPDPDARAERHFVQSTVASEFETRTSARTLYPDGIVVGWVHGHVRHGARYSSTDRENQTSWRQAHSLGIVVDPWDPIELAVYRGPDSEHLGLAPPLGALRAATLSSSTTAPSQEHTPKGDAARAGFRPTSRRPRRLWGGLILGLLVTGVFFGFCNLREAQLFGRRVGAIERRLGALEERDRCVALPAAAPAPTIVVREEPSASTFDAGTERPPAGVESIGRPPRASRSRLATRRGGLEFMAPTSRADVPDEPF